jgi:hypothetical protein
MYRLCVTPFFVALGTVVRYRTNLARFAQAQAKEEVASTTDAKPTEVRVEASSQPLPVDGEVAMNHDVQAPSSSEVRGEREKTSQRLET